MISGMLRTLIDRVASHGRYSARSVTHRSLCAPITAQRADWKNADEALKRMLDPKAEVRR